MPSLSLSLAMNCFFLIFIAPLSLSFSRFPLLSYSFSSLTQAFCTPSVVHSTFSLLIRAQQKFWQTYNFKVSGRNVFFLYIFLSSRISQYFRWWVFARSTFFLSLFFFRILFFFTDCNYTSHITIIRPRSLSRFEFRELHTPQPFSWSIIFFSFLQKKMWTLNQ